MEEGSALALLVNPSGYYYVMYSPSRRQEVFLGMGGGGFKSPGSERQSQVSQ